MEQVKKKHDFHSKTYKLSIVNGTFIRCLCCKLRHFDLSTLFQGYMIKCGVLFHNCIVCKYTVNMSVYAEEVYFCDRPK